MTQKKAETPLMKQYYRIKDENPGAILLFRMGDFYETFGEDARHVAPILGITLTKRSNGKAADVALAGFPHHALDTYLPKLVRAGLRVAICEQVEDPKKTRKLVKRDVVEVVSPGVVMRDHLLDPGMPSYLVTISINSDRIAGVAVVDASTGEFSVGEFHVADLPDLLDSISPAEVLVEKGTRRDLSARALKHTRVTELEPWMFTYDFAYESLTDHFGTHSLKGFGIQEMSSAIIAAGVALNYVKDSQKMAPSYVRSIGLLDNSQYMLLDAQTRRNLELINSPGSGAREDSLLAILDDTKTPMGARNLRRWLLNPLKSADLIQLRIDAVAAAAADGTFRRRLQDILEEISDIERLATRVSVNRASPRDINELKRSLTQLPDLVSCISQVDTQNWKGCSDRLSLEKDLVQLIDSALNGDPPATIAKGGVIRDGFNPELDELRSISSSGKEWIARLQREESERTGIPSLKVGFNRVFGYFLEVTNAHKDKVPDDFIRKQTLVNAERYITPALKEYEEKVLSAEEKIAGLEHELFQQLCLSVAGRSAELLQNAAAIAEIDTYCSLGEVAVRNVYSRPEITTSRILEIKAGRHPVVEHRLPVGESFIPNDIKLDPDSAQILIVTGPNMAGKSVVLRQTGLIVLMAQIGSFVPAEYASIGVVDRIFTRVGASDNLSEGESTFLVEMNETANILNNATHQSLILFDEVGRGTSTFDGMSIAWSLVEYLHETPAVAAKTVFATHYHELNELAQHFSRVRNYRVHVEEHDGKVIFLRKLIEGGADHSFGIEVARMAGLPAEVIDRASDILTSLENQKIAVGSMEGRGDGAAEVAPVSAPTGVVPARRAKHQISLFAQDPDLEEIRDALSRIDPDRLTPVEALLKIVDLRNRLSPEKPE
ncbi:MAG: DNA mismatch repair protein MutS [Rhodothermales bacterium]|nr:DNA mismatch repair protein MutS [Rhodothermales bacterium]